MFGEKNSFETIESERVLEGAEREEFKKGLEEFILGLEAVLGDQNLSEDDRVDLEEQLLGLKDSLEEIDKGGNVKMKV